MLWVTVVVVVGGAVVDVPGGCSDFDDEVGCVAVVVAVWPLVVTVPLLFRTVNGVKRTPAVEFIKTPPLLLLLTLTLLLRRENFSSTVCSLCFIISASRAGRVCCESA
jgi:hypothetical protein